MDKPITQTVCARVPTTIHEALDRVRRSERRTLSQVIRNILQDWYENEYQDWQEQQPEKENPNVRAEPDYNAS